MKLSLTVPISAVPDGTIVRKPQGEVLFEVQRVLKIFVNDGSGPNQVIDTVAGSVFMLERGMPRISQVSGDRLVTVDFDHADGLRAFLKEIEVAP